MINTIKAKYCNYNECNRKDLKRYKICKRCKSVFYCNRKHQKFDWNRGKHSKECIDRPRRDWSERINNTDTMTFINTRQTAKLFRLYDDIIMNMMIMQLN